MPAGGGDLRKPQEGFDLRQKESYPGSLWVNPVHSLTIDVDVKSLLNVHMALIQNQPISTASAEDNNQRFSADNNNQDFPPSPLQGLLLPPWSWWQRLASRLSHLQLLLEMLWLNWSPPSDEITSGKDPPILGAETPQRLTAEKSKWGTGMHTKFS